MKIAIVFYSMYGHLYQMAQAVAEGARSVPGAEVSVFKVQETIPDAVLEQYGAKAAQAAFADVPVMKPSQLADYDAILFGTPTRFGMMAAQMRNFLDQTGKLWAEGALVGKVGSVFTASATQHGGQESTTLSFHTTLLHHGMVIVGVPFTHPELSSIGEMHGGAPYGASTIAGGDGSRQPSAIELDIARFQGKHVAEIAGKLAR